MPMRISSSGNTVLLGSILNSTAFATLTVRLYINNFTITDTSTTANFTEATFAGYSAQALTGANWTVANTTGTAVASYPAIQWSVTATTNLPQTIYGYYITSGAGNTLVGADRFGTPISLTAANVTGVSTTKVEVNPFIQLEGSNTAQVDAKSIDLDANQPTSYPGTGTTWYSLINTALRATLFNAPTFSSGAFTFNGTTQYALVTGGALYDNSATNNPWTVHVWIRSTQTTGGTIFGLQDTTTVGVATSWIPILYLNTNGTVRAEAMYAPALNNTVTSTQTVNDNLWHLISLTFSAGVSTLYIDGQSAATASGITISNTPFATNSFWFIGAGEAASRGLGTDWFAGDIAQFRFQNRALSATEVQTYYFKTRPRFVGILQ